jgi:hypothetical protein
MPAKVPYVVLHRRRTHLCDEIGPRLKVVSKEYFAYGGSWPEIDSHGIRNKMVRYGSCISRHVES